MALKESVNAPNADESNGDISEKTCTHADAETRCNNADPMRFEPGGRRRCGCTELRRFLSANTC